MPAAPQGTMTTAQTSVTIPTVQTRKRGKSKPPECAPKRLNYRFIVRETALPREPQLRFAQTLL
jgi:hypothetical protein